jgi:hypothetical protein
MASVVNVNDLLEGHVTLDLECLDRIYLNAYVPGLQVPGQVVSFFTAHRGEKIPSPVLMERNGNRFRKAVRDFAEANGVPLVRFDRGARKLDVMRPRFERATRPGVVAIGVAQEFQSVWTATKAEPDKPGCVFFRFYRADRRVSVFYFYILDADFGPTFIKVCTYFPYPAKVWLNGHEWLKRQAARADLETTALANGVASCSDPARLQAIADSLGPADIEAFFDRWSSVLPGPLTDVDHDAGYWWQLSMRQVEFSRTIVFDAPRRGRAFFEATVADNLDLGRPDEVAVIFDRKVIKTTPGTFSTKVVTRGVEVAVNVFYKHSRIKEYLKEGRALRIETVVNSADDFGVKRRLEHLGELVAKARAANRRLLAVQRAGQGCAISASLFERVALPSVEEGQRTGALRFGDQRVTALAGALCVALNTVVGFTNRSLRAQVSALLGGPYSSSQMTYDLRRLRMKGLIRRLPRSNTYVLTAEGLRWALFSTKVRSRVLEPLLEANQPPAPVPLRRALATIEHHVADYVDRARIREAA